MKESPLLETIKRLHGENLTLAGYVDTTWRLPAYYAPRGQAQAAVAAEYAAVTADDGLAIADRSWRSVVQLKGRDRASFLQGQLTNDIAALAPGEGCRAAMLGSNGHMLADVAVHVLENSILLTVDPRAAETLMSTLDKYLIAEKVLIDDVSDKAATITIDGGRAVEALGGLGIDTLPERPYGNAVANVDGVDVIVMRSGPRGYVNYDLRLPVDAAPGIWETLVQAGAVPIGEMTLETVRVESGDPAWGAELDHLVLFPEVELTEALSYNKGCYVGQEIIARIHARGHTNRSLRAILFDEVEESMQPGDLLYPDAESFDAPKEIGRVTSVVSSPRFDGRTLALGYVRKEHVDDGTSVICRFAHKEAHGTVMTIPIGG